MQDESQMTSLPPPAELLVTVEEAARRPSLTRTTLYLQTHRCVIPSDRVRATPLKSLIYHESFVR